MSRFLVTGFEPFTTGQGLVLEENPTSVYAKKIAHQCPQTIDATLPVSYSRTKTAFTDLLNAHRPEVWLGLGYAPHRKQIDVEYIALNVEHSCVGDNDGDKPEYRPIIERAPMALTTFAPIAKVVDVLTRRGLACQPGFHAGTFLCNQVFFLGCYAVEVEKVMSRALFIHVPPAIDEADFVEGCADILNLLGDGSRR